MSVFQKVNGLWVPEDPPPPDHVPTNAPQWEVFMGNNFIRIAKPATTFGGGVSIGQYNGLTLLQTSESRGWWDGLWRDLIFRIQINGLCVYKHDMMQWSLGWGPGHCNIQLDANERISSIYVVPYSRPKDN